MSVLDDTAERQRGGASSRERTRGGRRARRALAAVSATAAMALLAAACGSSRTTAKSSVKLSTQAATAAAAGTNVNPANMPESTTAFRMGYWAWNSEISYNPYSPDYVPFGDFALLTLGAYSDWARPGPNPYLPELASSWSIGSHSITFNIRSGAKWQNGQPVTSKDVLTSLLLSGANYNSVWAAIRSISAPSASEVVITFHHWVVIPNVMEELLQVVILPSSQYGFMIPSNFESDLFSYWKTYNYLHPTTASITSAGNSAAGKVVAATDAKLLKFNPSRLIGDGPYTLDAATVSGVLYKKWMGWWDAKAITAPWVQIIPTTLAGIYGAQITGTIDFNQITQFTDPEVTKLDASNAKYVFIPSPVQQESLVFHFADYPYNILQVRQALAYLINRKKLTELDMGGSLIQDPPTRTPDGINHFMADKYLTSSQFASLKHYAYNPKKAAALLESVGFKKRGGVWYTPKGSVWHVTITEEAGNSHFDEDGIAIANMLKSFGIRADSIDANAATYYSEERAGDYAISENLMDWGGTPNPIGDVANTFLSGSLPAWNYPLSYSGNGPFHGSVGIGIGPISDVPGLGTVNIAAALDEELNTAPPSEWAKYTWDWARWINENLPILPLYNNAFHESYSMARYTDFPPTSAKWLWTGLGGAAQPVMWMEEGYLRLRTP